MWAICSCLLVFEQSYIELLLCFRRVGIFIIPRYGGWRTYNFYVPKFFFLRTNSSFANKKIQNLKTPVGQKLCIFQLPVVDDGPFSNTCKKVSSFHRIFTTIAKNRFDGHSLFEWRSGKAVWFYVHYKYWSHCPHFSTVFILFTAGDSVHFSTLQSVSDPDTGVSAPSNLVSLLMIVSFWQ